MCWVREMSGGISEPILLMDISSFLKQLHIHRVVRGHVLEALATMKVLRIMCIRGEHVLTQCYTALIAMITMTEQASWRASPL